MANHPLSSTGTAKSSDAKDGCVEIRYGRNDEQALQQRVEGIERFEQERKSGWKGNQAEELEEEELLGIG